MPLIRGRQSKLSGPGDGGSRINTLGLGLAETDALLDEIDRKLDNAKASAKRTFTRLQFRNPSLQLNIIHPGGSTAHLRVVCRNISRSGIGVLHNSFMHANTRCTVHIPTNNGAIERLEGTIVRCSHITGRIHELGMLFDEPIRIEKYTELDPSTGITSFECVNPEEIRGTAVALLASEIEARMLGHFLTDSQLSLKITENPDEGAAHIAEGCDIVLVDLTVPCAEEMALAARQASTGLPIIAIAPDSSRETKALAKAMGIGGLLTKPLKSDRLLSMLAECLLTTGSLETSLAEESDLSPELVSACIDQLHAIVLQLRNAAEGEDPMQCYALCQQIKATCQPVGLPEVNEAADRAAATLSQSKSLNESQKTIQELLRLCDRVKKPA